MSPRRREDYSLLHPDRGTYPNLYAHYDRMMGRPAVQKTLKAEAAVGYNLPG